MKDLKLVLKRKWFEMISSGEKKEEYREIKDYWIKRLTNSGCHYLFGLEQVPYKHYDTVTFYLGYSANRSKMTFKVDEIILGYGRRDWGAESGKLYFVIKLGDRTNGQQD